VTLFSVCELQALYELNTYSINKVLSDLNCAAGRNGRTSAAWSSASTACETWHEGKWCNFVLWV